MTDRYATLRDGLTGAWCPSLAATGSLLVDYSAYRCNATLSGSATWSAGAIDLSATSTFADIPHRSVHNPSASGFSLSVWFSTPTTSLNFADVIASKVDNFLPYYAWSIQGNGTGILVFGMANTAGSTVFPSATGIAANRWYHICGTYDGSTARVFLNGVETGNAALSGTPFTTTNNARISETVPFTGRQWPGLIDDMRLYGRALRRSEIALLATRRGIGLQPTRHRRAKVLGSQFWTRDAGTWKKATTWINVGGTWKQGTPKINVGGTWK